MTGDFANKVTSDGGSDLEQFRFILLYTSWLLKQQQHESGGAVGVI